MSKDFWKKRTSYSQESMNYPKGLAETRNGQMHHGKRLLRRGDQHVREIEETLHKIALASTLAKGPVSSSELYNSLAKEKARLIVKKS